MSDDLRIRGQEISIRIIQGGVVVNDITAISSFNDEDALEIKEDGFLGENVNRFDEIVNGFGGDMEFQVSKGNAFLLRESILAKAMRRTPDVIFNVVRTMFFANGDTVIKTYRDVHWGSIPTTSGSRTDYVKLKLAFKCSEAPIDINALP